MFLNSGKNGAQNIEHRADFLFRTAVIMRRRKHEFSSYLMKEEGSFGMKLTLIRQKQLTS